VCGLDPKHPVLTGAEMRECWTAAPLPPDPEGRPARPATGVVVPWVDELVAPRPRTFVPVEPSGPTATAVLEATAIAVTTGTAPPAVAVEIAMDAPTPAPEPADPVPGRWWLWGDPAPWPEP
jgi:hypothetical protein